MGSIVDDFTLIYNAIVNPIVEKKKIICTENTDETDETEETGYNCDDIYDITMNDINTIFNNTNEGVNYRNKIETVARKFQENYLDENNENKFNNKMQFKKKIKSLKKNKDNYKKNYADMKLYQEILFLKHYFNGKYVVENVIPYYEPLISAKKRGRHLYWTNFNLPNKIGRNNVDNFSKTDIESLSNYHDYNFRKYKGKQSIGKVGRNLVDYEAGKTIFETALGIIKKQNVNQTELF